MLLTAGFQLKPVQADISKISMKIKTSIINTPYKVSSSYRIATIALQFRSQQSNFSSEFINHRLQINWL